MINVKKLSTYTFTNNIIYLEVHNRIKYIFDFYVIFDATDERSYISLLNL